MKPRRDPKYLAWLVTQLPLVSGSGRLTIHHVRRCGDARDDRRTVLLPEEKHLLQAGPYSSIEALGKRRFEQRYGVDLEAAIVRYNALYEAQRRQDSLANPTKVKRQTMSLPRP